MADLRRALFLVVGLFIGGYSAYSLSADFPALVKGASYDGKSVSGSSYDALCKGLWDNVVSGEYLNNYQVRCWRVDATGYKYRYDANLYWHCPYGGGLNINYTPPMCLGVPDCPVGQSPDPVTGECKQPQKEPCPTGAANSGYYDMGTSPSPGSSVPAYACANNCPVIFSGTCPAASGDVGGVKHYYCQGSYDYQQGAKVGDCTGSDMPGTSAPPDNPANCPAGQTKVGTRADGTPICAKADDEQGQCGAGQTQVGTRADGSPICADNNPEEPKQGQCGAGQTQVGTRADGSPICNNNGPDQGQCAAGQQQIGTRADGSPLCVDSPDDNPDPGTDPGDSSPDPKTDDEQCEAPKVKDSNGNCVTPPPEGCDPATDPNKCEASMPENGTLWTRQDKTFATVFGNFKAKMSAAPIIQNSQGWINISVPSGNCPDLSVTVPYLNAHISLGEYFCSSAAQNMMNLAGAVLLAVAAFAAFRWAFL